MAHGERERYRHNRSNLWGPSKEEPPHLNGGFLHSLDRVVFQVTDPDAGFRFFAETLGLPVLGPLARSERSAAGIFLLGNVELELLHLTNDDALPLSSPLGTLNIRFLSAAWCPQIPVEHVPSTLERRGFPLLTSKVHEGPIPEPLRPYTEPAILQADRPTIATTVTVHGVIQPSWEPSLSAVQIIKYTHDVDRRREDECAALARHHGGPLGLLDVQSVWAEAVDMERGLNRWQQFLHPTPPCGSSRWDFASGPSLRVRQGVTNGWGGLLLRVAALDRAVS